MKARDDKHSQRGGVIWRGGFRPDVEGLRAVAMSCALLAHGGVAVAAGGYIGVDMFYVISGFLITGLLMRELEREGRIHLLDFYARRARRLLPAATFVIGVIVVFSLLLLPPARQLTVAGDVIASSLYFANWRFTAQSADYFAPVTETSPLQHYWSLGVEEQFYLVWPLILLATVLLMGRYVRVARKPALAVVLALSAASLLYSAIYSYSSPNQAYFSTFTRAWELGAGAILALVPLPRLGRVAAGALAGLGLAMIAAATLLYSAATPYPGVAGLLPVLGTAAVIVSGTSGRMTGPLRVVGAAPVRYFGRISYSTYLWHWPVLIFATATFGELALWQSAIAIAVAIGLASLTYHTVERPFMRSQFLSRVPRRSLAFGAGCVACSVIAALVLVRAQPNIDTISADEVQGASALAYQTEPQRRPNQGLRPNPLKASADRGRLVEDGCLVQREVTESPACTYGGARAKAKVVLFGDSHAAHFFPALERIAERRNWRLTGLTKMGCAPADVLVWNNRLGRAYDECVEWRRNALERIVRERPDLVVVSGASFYSVMEDDERLEDSTPVLEERLVRTLERIRESGAKVVLIGDIPHAPFEVSDCVSENLDSLDECAFPYEERRNRDPFDRRAAKRVRGVKVVEVTDALCPRGLCRAVIGDALTYRGSNHLTATYSRTLAPFLERKLPDPR